jgi:hypothetical protein
MCTFAFRRECASLSAAGAQIQILARDVDYMGTIGASYKRVFSIAA